LKLINKKAKADPETEIPKQSTTMTVEKSPDIDISSSINEVVENVVAASVELCKENDLDAIDSEGDRDILFKSVMENCNIRNDDLKIQELENQMEIGVCEELIEGNGAEHLEKEDYGRIHDEHCTDCTLLVSENNCDLELQTPI